MSEPLDTPFLSLVIPVYRGAGFIESSLRAVLKELDRALGRPYEVVVVCDGDDDGTAEHARRVKSERVRVLDYSENQGKGHAICHGIAASRGRLIGWLDADMDLAPSVIVDAVRLFEAGGEQIDAVVGSKRHPRSRVTYPAQRRVLSWGYQMLVRILFRVNVRDTQVGAKVLRRELLDTVAPLLLIKRYAFDLEVLAVGAEFGFDRITETPIELQYRFSGTGIDAPAVRRMFVDTLAIAYRIHVRHWYVRQYARRQRDRFADRDPHPPLDTAVAAQRHPSRERAA